MYLIVLTSSKLLIKIFLNSVNQQSAANFYAGGVAKTSMHAMVENTVKTRYAVKTRYRKTSVCRTHNYQLLLIR